MEHVILVNEFDEELGIMEKMEAHEKALLHRAISIFIFNSKGEMLLQQRSAKKYHSAGLWTNACCSHPRPGETILAAAERRLHEELGFTTPLHKVFEFTYKTPFDNGLTEYEFDHVFTGKFDGIVLPNPDEVNDCSFKSMQQLESSLQSQPHQYTSWFIIAFPQILNWCKQQSLK